VNEEARLRRREAVLLARCRDCRRRVIAEAHWVDGQPMLWTAGPTAEHGGWWRFGDGRPSGVPAWRLLADGWPDGVAAWCRWGRHWLDLTAPGRAGTSAAAGERWSGEPRFPFPRVCAWPAPAASGPHLQASGGAGRQH
jgi:hypothetical protein